MSFLIYYTSISDSSYNYLTIAVDGVEFLWSKSRGAERQNARLRVLGPLGL